MGYAATVRPSERLGTFFSFLVPFFDEFLSRHQPAFMHASLIPLQATSETETGIVTDTPGTERNEGLGLTTRWICAIERVAGRSARATDFVAS